MTTCETVYINLYCIVEEPSNPPDLLSWVYLYITNLCIYLKRNNKIESVTKSFTPGLWEFIGTLWKSLECSSFDKSGVMVVQYQEKVWVREDIHLEKTPTYYIL